jgi:hypothetical protein
MKDILLLQKAIRETHGCGSKHVESVTVKEVFEGQIAWEGTVEVFYLVGHPESTWAYAWSYRDGDQNKSVAVLGIPPVDSPQMAVKIAIASRGKRIVPTNQVSFKNEAAAELGRLGRGKPKRLSTEDRERRRQLMIRLNEIRELKKRSEPQ